MLRPARTARRWPIVALSCATLALTALALGRQPDDQPKPEAGADQPKEAGAATAETLGGEARYLTHLSTDKPVYRAGESLQVKTSR